MAVTPGVAPSLALPDHGPCFVGGIFTLYDTSITTKIAVPSEVNAVAPYGFVAFVDTGCPQTFIRRDVLDRMLSLGRHPSRACRIAPLESVPLQMWTSIRLNIYFFRDDEPTCSLAVWVCVVPPSVMRHAVLLGCDS